MIKLITFLFAAIPAGFTAFLAFFSRKYFTIIAYLLAAGSMLVIFIACINVILQTVLVLIQIPSWIQVPLGMFIPTNFAMVLSAMVSARICRAAYDFAARKAEVMASAN